MKHMRKIMALAIAMVMVLSMGITVFAAPTNVNLTVPNETGHTYEIFQIFTGDLADGKLSNVTWGVNGAGTEGDLVDEDVLTALEAISSSTSTADQTTIDSILTALGMTKANLADASAFKKDVAAGGVESVPTGYYIVKDKDNSLTNAEDDAYTLLLISVVGPTTLTAKSEIPEVEKKVTDVNDSDATVEADQDSADYDIGDAVPFKLTATLADNVSAYKKYHITFVDTLESGKFSAISALTIKMNGVAIAAGEGYTVSTTGYTGDVAPSVDGFKQTIEFTPTGDYLPASLNGAEVTVEFTATLGPNAAIGAAGNKNEVELEYSNNPNDVQGGEEGKTPKDTVRVFTYKLTVNKVDEEGEDLVGADFTLYKKVPTAAAGATQAGTKGSDIKAEFDSSIKADALEDNSYYVVAGTKSGTTAGSEFSFNGIDDGTYVLVETTVPAGYNAWDSVEFDVEATHETESTDPQLTSLTGGDLVFGDFKDTGIITTDIENKQGNVLPSTGGIGTTIFYIVGAILVLGAGIVLVTRRRMSAN